MSEAVGQPLFCLKNGLRLVLASSSPRRKQFFSELGLPFISCDPKNEPAPEASCDPLEYVRKAARAKTQECCQECATFANCVIIGADTAVLLDGKILGKPQNHAQALEMLAAQNGRTSIVASAACIVLPKGDTIDILDQTKVIFRHWPIEVLASYASSPEPMDKAGAFAIQGAGSFLIDRIDGNYTTVVGLPGPQIIALLLEKDIITHFK